MYNLPAETVHGDIAFKLYNDKITLTQFRRIKKNFEYFDLWHKVDLNTGALLPWTVEDWERYVKNKTISINRAVSNIYDICELNKFDLFGTATFNEKYVDREDPLSVQRAYVRIMKRLKYHYGDIQYLAVSEFHKDGKGIHYHFLCKFKKLPGLTFKGYTAKGQALYTLRKKFKNVDCFLTFEKLEKNNPGYLVKYMTKNRTSPMARRYSCSCGLVRSRVVAAKRYSGTFSLFERVAGQYGFEPKRIGREFDTCYLLGRRKGRNPAHPRGSAARGADLSNTYITCENSEELARIYNEMTAEFERQSEIYSQVLRIQRENIGIEGATTDCPSAFDLHSVQMDMGI